MTLDATRTGIAVDGISDAVRRLERTRWYLRHGRAADAAAEAQRGVAAALHAAALLSYLRHEIRRQHEPPPNPWDAWTTGPPAGIRRGHHPAAAARLRQAPRFGSQLRIPGT